MNNSNERTMKALALTHAIMVMSCAILYSVTSSKSCAAITTAFLLAIQFFTKRRVEYSDRSIIYTVIIAFVYSYAADIFSPFDKNFYILVGDIFSTSISAPFLLYMAAGIALFRHNEYSFGVSAAFCMMSALLTSDINPSASSLKPNAYYSFYLIMIALITFLITAGIQFLKYKSLKSLNVGSSRIKLALLWLAFATSILFSGISIYSVRKFENSIRLLDIFITKYALLHMQKGRYIAFGKDVNLNRTIDLHTRRNSAKIVIRAVSSTPPDYLRGRAYDRYAGGRWTDSNSLAIKKMRLAKQEEILAFNRFLDDDSPEELSKMIETRIFPDKYLLSEVLLAPANSLAIDIFANAVSRSPNGNIYPEEWDRGTAFTTYGNAGQDATAFRLPSPPLDKRLTEVPPQIQDELDGLISEALKDKKPGDIKSDAELVRLLEKHFLDNFKYEIVEDVERTPRKDPVLAFLERKTGHCELFATAMTLALRKMGLPARYVTGFVCNEFNPQAKYYVSRIGDAHAWVEAYLRDEGRWVLAEPTPPSAIPNYKHEWGTFEKLLDSFKTIVMKMFDDVKKGYFAKAVIEAIVSIFYALKGYFLHPSALFFFLIAIIVIVLKIRHHYRHKASAASKLEGTRLEISLEISRAIKKLSRKIGVQKKRGQTVAEWLESASLARPKLAEDFKKLEEIYQAVRFSPKLPAPECLDKLKQAIARIDIAIKIAERA